ncbi:MAG: hypothetical protein OEW83_21070 [Acidimicrobiia bacterium]|nr:hypothetical protein [Acidimicrobiia bacterium]
MVAALLLSIVGIPLAIRQLVRYQFLPQVVVLEGLDGRQTLSRSSDLVTGKWWQTAAVIGTINIGLSVAALLTGLVVLVVFSGIPFWLFSAIISLISAIVVPPAAIAQSLLYGDAVAEEARSEEQARLAASI